LSITDAQAIDIIQDDFLTYWNANIASVGLDHTPVLHWPNVETDSQLDTNKHHLRFKIEVLDQPQTTLALNPCYTTFGFLTIQFFFSRVKYTQVDDVAMRTIARDAFRNASNSVWYRNARSTAVNPEEIWYRAKVVADFVYDT
jgi:hypothetical protein